MELVLSFHVYMVARIAWKALLFTELSLAQYMGCFAHVLNSFLFNNHYNV